MNRTDICPVLAGFGEFFLNENLIDWSATREGIEEVFDLDRAAEREEGTNFVRLNHLYNKSLPRSLAFIERHFIQLSVRMLAKPSGIHHWDYLQMAADDLFVRSATHHLQGNVTWVMYGDRELKLANHLATFLKGVRRVDNCGGEIPHEEAYQLAWDAAELRSIGQDIQWSTPVQILKFLVSLDHRQQILLPEAFTEVE